MRPTLLERTVLDRNVLLRALTGRRRAGAFYRRIVNGWGTYRRGVTDLPAPQQEALAMVGDLILASYGPGRSPIQVAHVYGHADHDTPRNPARERQMSDERARQVVGWLQRYVGPAVSRRVSWQAIAVGAARLQAAPTTEANRRKNRRVEICLGSRPAAGPVAGRPMAVAGTRRPRFFQLVAPHIHKQTGARCWANALASWRPAQQAWDEAKAMNIPQLGLGFWTDPNHVLAEHSLFLRPDGSLEPLDWPAVATQERMDFVHLSGRDITPSRILTRLRQSGYLYWSFQRQPVQAYAHAEVIYGAQLDSSGGALMVMDPQRGAWDYPSFLDVATYAKNTIAWRGTGREHKTL